MVRKSDLVNCQYLKNGVTVEFECHSDNRGLIAKKVSLSRSREQPTKHFENRYAKKNPFGVMREIPNKSSILSIDNQITINYSIS